MITKTLKLGSVGDDVISWQTFLKGLFKTNLIIDGDFGEQTYKLTLRFQLENGIPQDGIVGPKTLAKALQVGLHLPDTSYTSNVSMLSESDKKQLFGSFSYIPEPQPNNPEGIKILGSWVGDNISIFNIPQLKTVTGAPKSGNVYFHKQAGPIFQKLFQTWEDEGLMQYVISWEGSFFPRFVRGSKTYLSNHCYGSAFDINGLANRLGSTPAQIGERGSVHLLVPFAESLGVFWGGNFDRPDGMHFEIGKSEF